MMNTDFIEFMLNQQNIYEVNYNVFEYYNNYRDSNCMIHYPINNWIKMLNN